LLSAIDRNIFAVYRSEMHTIVWEIKRRTLWIFVHFIDASISKKQFFGD